uniref:O-methyltransferase domain-containing protein n=1 Tax=Glycine max TaxID=3847 RepID=A0A0R0IRY8_SOYBN
MASSMNGRNVSEIFQGQTLLYKHLYAFIDSMCLKRVVELWISDKIHNHAQSITLPELVSVLLVPSTKIGQVQSLMHYLAHNGFFERFLLKSNELSLAPMVEFVLNPTLSNSYHQLKKWVYEKDLTLFDISLGSQLTTAKIICEAFPNLKCIVFDRPQRTCQGSNNLTFVGGDMFKSIPKADSILLKWILHNWFDKDCIKILKNCKEYMKPFKSLFFKNI